LNAVVQAALTHYTRRLGSHWQPVEMPSFMDARLSGGDLLELTIAPELEAELEREADKQRVPLEEILRHAVLVYLADLDVAEASEGRDVVGKPIPLAASADPQTV